MYMFVETAIRIDIQNMTSQISRSGLQEAHVMAWHIRATSDLTVLHITQGMDHKQDSILQSTGPKHSTFKHMQASTEDRVLVH